MTRGKAKRCREKPSRRKQDDGFTLIEMLIAFLILAMSMTVLSQSISQATSQIKGAEVINASRLLAGQVLASAKASPLLQRSGNDSLTGLYWRWQRKPFVRTEETGPLPTFRLLTIEIRHSEAAAPIYVIKSAEQAPLQ